MATYSHAWRGDELVGPAGIATHNRGYPAASG
jgi:hypothetical protein